MKTYALVILIGDIVSVNKHLIDVVCQEYQLGIPKSQFNACVGGRLHRVYQFETSQGRYILKLLNPDIIMQADKQDRYRVTEEIARELAKTVSLIPALTHAGDPLLTYADETMLIYPYVDATILLQNEIMIHHVEKIGQALATIHQADLKHLPSPAVELLVLTVLDNENKKKNIVLRCQNIAEQIANCEAIIDEIAAYCSENQTLLQQNVVISHRDCDPKNVLWDKKDNYFLIDWESAGQINRMKDLVATAIYWSLDDKYKVDPLRLAAFIEAYQQHQGHIQKSEMAAGLYGLLGDWLGWLDFNLLRLINHEINSAEFELGRSEARLTLHALPIIYKQIPSLLNHFASA